MRINKHNPQNSFTTKLEDRKQNKQTRSPKISSIAGESQQWHHYKKTIKFTTFSSKTFRKT
uniref:Uncharacterized protein n=1 Tax=Rhizophora mucronata TaxID=61149 RepID=A0A2P2PLQ9_RHIMU